MDNRHQAMFDFFSQYPDTHNMLGFNFTDAQDRAMAIQTVSSQRVAKVDILGRRTIEYTFAVVVFRNYSPNPCAEENIEAIQAAQDFMAWIDEQEAIHNYPTFENAKVKKIENLQDMPTVAGESESMRLAKYMFQCKVTYQELS